MSQGELPALIAGPYAAPRCKIGDELAGEIVHGFTSAAIPWPFTRSRNHGQRLILWGDLIDAVLCESVAAIMAHWGVGRSTVQGWRRQLGVPQFNAGTLAQWWKIEKG